MSLVKELDIDIKNLTLSDVMELYQYSEYPLFTKGDYNINIFGIRNPNPTVDTFDDVIGIVYKVKGEWKLFKMPATTDSGLYYMRNPMNKDGCGFLAEGFYKGMWKIGFFHGVECLIQEGMILYYRDNNKDDVMDLIPTTKMKGGAEIGCFLHPHFQVANIAQKVWNSSAMCQVPKSNADFALFMEIVKKSRSLYGNHFSYSLFN